jgi:hypothetical protein
MVSTPKLIPAQPSKAPRCNEGNTCLNIKKLDALGSCERDGWGPSDWIMAILLLTVLIGAEVCWIGALAYPLKMVVGSLK